MPVVFADHILALVLAVGLPIHAARGYRTFLKAVAEKRDAVRIREYRRTILVEWGLVAATLVLWLAAGRPLPLLGLSVPGGIPGRIGAGVMIGVLFLLVVQWRAIRRARGESLEALRRQLDPVSALMPRTKVEYRTFQGLAITAGICEEVLMRGFLIWYLAHWLGLWPAVLVSGIIFGLGHAYQGRAGVFKTGVVGWFAGALYVGSGSLLWGMVLHAAIDLQGGAAGWRVLGESDTPER
jgi:membrane protease YdiL (CAAX protease family)